MLLRFEDLIAEPGSSVERLCSHVGVDFTEAMLDQIVLNSSLSPSGASTGFDPAVVERWREHMSPLTKRWFAALCGREMQAFGYCLSPAENRRINLAWEAHHSVVRSRPRSVLKRRISGTSSARNRGLCRGLHGQPVCGPSVPTPNAPQQSIHPPRAASPGNRRLRRRATIGSRTSIASAGLMFMA